MVELGFFLGGISFGIMIAEIFLTKKYDTEITELLNLIKELEKEKR